MQSRRNLILNAVKIGIASGTTVIVSGLAVAKEKLFDVSTNPVAKALQYVHDATKSKARKEKMGFKADLQKCQSCSLYKGDGVKGDCSLLPGVKVASKGWCASWVPKEGLKKS